VLADPPVELVLSTRVLGKLAGGPYALEDEGTVLSGPAGKFRLGDALDVVVTDVDGTAGRIDVVPAGLAS